MVDSEKARFKKIMMMTGELYDKNITETLLDLYFSVLKDFSVDHVAEAFTAHIRSTDAAGTFFPKPADIIRLINGTKKEEDEKTDQNAEIAWSDVIGKVASLGSYRNFESDDKVSVAVIVALGGWMRVCSSNYDQLPWLKKEFISAYKSFSSKRLDELPYYAPGRVEIENDKAEDSKGLTSILDSLEKYKKGRNLLE